MGKRESLLKNIKEPPLMWFFYKQAQAEWTKKYAPSIDQSRITEPGKEKGPLFLHCDEKKEQSGQGG